MAKVKNVRRPVEYLLYVLLAVLIVISVWAIWQFRQLDYSDDKGSAAKADPGTSEQVGEYTESSIDSEEEALNQADESYQAQLTELESAANNVSGVYDETAY